MGSLSFCLYHQKRGEGRIYSLLLRVIAVLMFHQLVVSGDVETNPGPGLSDKPTMRQLIVLRKSDGSEGHLRVVDWISSLPRSKCNDFAHLLLNNSIQVRSHRKQAACDDEFVRAVLEDWLSQPDGGSADEAIPRTWAALAECVEDARLEGALAKAIRDNCSIRTSAGCITDQATHSQQDVGLANEQDSVQTTPAPPLPADCITEYQRYLRVQYHRKYPLYSKPQFTHHRPKHIVNLVLVHKEEDEGDKLQQQCLVYQLHGDIDMIQQKKTPLSKEQIGILDNGETPHCVLIEGAPGIGKTTFCWQLCHGWAEGKLLHDWELVVLIRLRDEYVRTAKCLSDLFHHPDRSVKEAISREIERLDGKGVLLLLDGYDELSLNQRSELSILNKVLCKQLLSEATIIVSSRPFATQALPHQFKQNLDQHVEIVGFSEDDVATYVKSACEGKDKLLADLRLYVSSQPFISSVMYNPLHCGIVIELYLQYWQNEKKGFVPNTLTELYNALLVNLMRRHLESDIETLEELPAEVHHKLMQLAELAATGIKEEKYVFDKISCDTLGLMQSVKQIHDIRPNRSTSYAFNHLTLQEYLAALYWSQLPSPEFNQLLQQLDWWRPVTEESLYRALYCEVKSHMIHWPVILFVTGLKKLNSVHHLRNTSAWYNSISHHMVRYHFHPAICHAVFESQCPQLVFTMFFAGREFSPDANKMSSPFDWFTTGYCIAHSDALASWGLYYDDRVNHIPQHLQMLSTGLHYSPTATNTNPSIRMTAEVKCFLPEFLQVFPSLYPNTQAITELGLFSELQSGDGVHVLQEIYSFCPRLQSLSVWLPLMKDISAFGKCLFQCRQLYDLTLGLHHDNGSKDITPFLHSIVPLLCRQIVNFDLSDIFITIAEVDILINTVISPCCHLQSLTLSHCTISSSDYYNLTTAAIANSNLKMFASSFLCIDVAAAKGLAIALKESKSLKHVQVDECPMDTDVAQTLVEAMNHSEVEILVIGLDCTEKIVSGCSYPKDRVKLVDIINRSYYCKCVNLQQMWENIKKKQEWPF